MKKYIAFELYQKNDLGGHQLDGDRSSKTVYLGTDVERQLNENAVIQNARIGELESLLRRVIEWTPALPAEASLADEIAQSLMEPGVGK